MTPQTTFAPVHNIFTNQPIKKPKPLPVAVEVKFVPIPNVHSKRKGSTKHDAEFEKLLDFKQAMQVPEDDFGGIRKSMQRFLENKGLRDKVSVRQHKDYKTKSVTIWLVNEPPRSTK